jgi:hypothetical protein
VGIVDDVEKIKSQIVFGYELEPVNRVKELKPDCVLITSLTEIEQRREKLLSFLGEGSICIKDICY